MYCRKSVKSHEKLYKMLYNTLVKIICAGYCSKCSFRAFPSPAPLPRLVPLYWRICILPKVIYFQSNLVVCTIVISANPISATLFFILDLCNCIVRMLLILFLQVLHCKVQMGNVGQRPASSLTQPTQKLGPGFEVFSFTGSCHKTAQSLHLQWKACTVL